MKRKKMTFSLKMLWEGFRQCKMIGIFAAVIIVLGAVLAPVAQVIEMRWSMRHGVRTPLCCWCWWLRR